MHRSNIIYNYDIPWNSTRLMQRIGRINRIGTRHDAIFIYNFKPTAQSEKLIELSKKAFIKLQTFHHSLGEDSKIYTKAEEVGSVSLFEENSESQIDEELLFLEEIRAYKEANPKTFKQIQKLPQKMRVQRAKRDGATSFVFIKNSESKNYFKVFENQVAPVNFVEMAKNIKASQEEKSALPLQEIHYEHVKLAREYFDGEFIKTISQSQTDNIAVEHKTDKQAITLLKSWYQKGFISSEYYERFVELVRIGRILNLSQEIVKISKNAKAFEIMAELDKLSQKYTLTQKNEENESISLKIDIILSETFV
jgi:superfamily II DNA/RNA helicase